MGRVPEGRLEPASHPRGKTADHRWAERSVARGCHRERVSLYRDWWHFGDTAGGTGAFYLASLSDCLFMALLRQQLPDLRTATLPTYVLITPARNEARFIEFTLRSVVGQEYRPMKWVIVSDGST